MIKPDITQAEAEMAFKATLEGEISPKGKYVEIFEEALAKYLSFSHAVFCNSGYSALLLAIRASGIKRIIVPSLSMIASATAPKHAGAEVIFADVNEKGLLEGDFGGHPIMIVDLYGNRSTAKSTNIIEDAAEVFGPLPYTGDIVCFSFYVNKIITTGNGGVACTNDSEKAKEMKLLRHHYYDGKSYYHAKDGYNLSSSAVNAAIGIEQLNRADSMLERRQALGQRYVKELGAWPCETYWYQPYLCADKEEKENLKAYLEKRRIDTRDFFTPLHEQPAFTECEHRGLITNTQQLFDRGILLPLYSAMTEKEQSYVIDKVKAFYK